MKNIIKLDNRENNETYLSKVEDKVYLINSPCSTYGVTGDKDDPHKMVAIDPSGGPYLAIGDTIEGNKIKEFSHIMGKGFTVIFE